MYINISPVYLICIYIININSFVQASKVGDLPG